MRETLKEFGNRIEGDNVLGLEVELFGLCVVCEELANLLGMGLVVVVSALLLVDDLEGVCEVE